uniref:uncharacterized protein LOC120336508 n=1 Tax=Styela clava TaxID=7725 RepID=UPI001939DB1F|nr:uncharacterized protein LOC120336508 [Styela clava]
MDVIAITIFFGLLLVGSSRGSSRSIECAEFDGDIIPIFSKDQEEKSLLNGESDYEAPVIMDAINDIAAKVDLVNSRVDRLLDQCRAPIREEEDPSLHVASSGDCEIEDFGLCFWLEALIPETLQC